MGRGHDHHHERKVSQDASIHNLEDAPSPPPSMDVISLSPTGSRTERKIWRGSRDSPEGSGASNRSLPHEAGFDDEGVGQSGFGFAAIQLGSMDSLAEGECEEASCDDQADESARSPIVAPRWGDPRSSIAAAGRRSGGSIPAAAPRFGGIPPPPLVGADDDVELGEGTEPGSVAAASGPAVKISAASALKSQSKQKDGTPPRKTVSIASPPPSPGADDAAATNVLSEGLSKRQLRYNEKNLKSRHQPQAYMGDDSISQWLNAGVSASVLPGRKSGGGMSAGIDLTVSMDDSDEESSCESCAEEITRAAVTWERDHDGDAMDVAAAAEVPDGPLRNSSDHAERQVNMKGHGKAGVVYHPSRAHGKERAKRAKQQRRGRDRAGGDEEYESAHRIGGRNGDDGLWRKPVIYGYELPVSCPVNFFSKPSWSRISSFIVRNAPCFWCFFRPLETSATDRAILFRLNVLCCVFAVGQVGVGIFFCIVMLSGVVDRDSDAWGDRNENDLTPNLWNLNGSIILIALVGLVLSITMLATLRVIREVNLLGAVRYMWVLLWTLPIETFLVISLFDYHRVTDVWITHWWIAPSMGWFRYISCAKGTYNTRCAAPELGGPDYDSVEEWCIGLYNMTDCLKLREDAQVGLRAGAYAFYTTNAVWGLLLVCLLLLALNVLEGIISAPIVQSSKETNIPAWLTLPIAACLISGTVLLFSPQSTLSISASAGRVKWIGIMYIVASGTFFFAALLGWFISAFSVLDSRDKQRKQCAVVLFIVLMVFTICAVGSIFITSLVFGVNVVGVNLSDEARGNMACQIDNGHSCSNCGNDDGLQECPEWSEDDVVTVGLTQLKQSATLAAICLVYAFSALRFGFVLRRHVMTYQIDYV